MEKAETYSTSDLAYALFGCAAESVYAGASGSRMPLERFAGLLTARQQSDGNFPAEHDEAPAGRRLSDLIYTDNWALLGLQCAASLDSRWESAYSKLLELLVSIQDRTVHSSFRGCWRGMYDLSVRRWGGGDRFEGGTNSIYTGWTNAPIALALVNALENTSLFPDGVHGVPAFRG